jgi:hypothetical protein
LQRECVQLRLLVSFMSTYEKGVGVQAPTNVSQCHP